VVAALKVEDRLAAESGAVVAAPGPAAAPADGFYLQLGAYSRAEKAEQVRNRLVDDGTVRGVLEVVPSGSLHRLVSGPFASKDEAQQASRELKAKGVASIVIRR
jgi:rare lipoprotein A